MWISAYDFIIIFIYDSNKKCEFLNKIKGCVLFIAFIIIISYVLINNISVNNAYDYHQKYESLSPEDKVILDNNEVLDTLIKYLKDGDKDLTKAALGILGLYFTIYNQYSNLNYFVDEWNKFVYIFFMLVILIVGLFLFSKSNERLILLGIFQHIQNSKRLDSNFKRYVDDKFEITGEIISKDTLDKLSIVREKFSQW